MYREFPPPDDLKALVRCFWILHVEDADKPREGLVVPDNCIDIIFDLKDGNPKGVVIGAMTGPITSRRTRLAGIRFQPYAAGVFFQIPMRAITDHAVDLREILPEDCDRLGESLQFKDPANCVGILADYVRRRLPVLSQTDRRMVGAVTMMEDSPQGLTVSALEDALNISREHLGRLFTSHTGLTPKQFLRVARLQNLIASVSPLACEPDWAETALSHGYYDQAHMIGDFRRLTGAAPGRYFAGRHA